MISVEKLSKTFTVHKKQPGLMASVKGLFVREKLIKHAVREVSFDVGEGEIVGLIGANGAGKTTLVKMLAGIIHPSAGKARVLDYEPWRRDNRYRRQIALIMGQKAQLWWDLPAGDCFLLLKEIYQIPDQRFSETLDYLCQTLGVEEEIHIQIRRLSLGERMKMELIAALLHSPRVVYLDEPTIGLDLTAQRAIREFLLEYREAHQPAMILTSHYMEDIERLCKRIMIIREGRIVYDGSLDQVVREYAADKILTAHLKPVETLPDATLLPGTVLDFGRDLIRLQVPRDKMTDAAQQVLSRFPVADLSIEDVDIGTVIEQIQAIKGSE